MLTRGAVVRWSLPTAIPLACACTSLSSGGAPAVEPVAPPPSASGADAGSPTDGATMGEAGDSADVSPFAACTWSELAPPPFRPQVMAVVGTEVLVAGTMGADLAVALSGAGGAWTVVDAWRPPGSEGASARHMFALPTGQVFVQGEAGFPASYDAGPGYVANASFVRRRTGTAWQTVDTLGPAGSGIGGNAGGVAADGAGRVMAVHWPTDAKPHVVRLSENDGDTWSTVYSGTDVTMESKLTATPSGFLWVGARYGTGFPWLVRSTTNRGASWDDLEPTAAPGPTSGGVPYSAVEWNGVPYVAGTLVLPGAPSNTSADWVVRRRSASPVRWDITDAFKSCDSNDAGTTCSAGAFDLVAAPKALHAVGAAFKYVANTNTMEERGHVRSSVDGTTWFATGAFDARATRAAIDTGGNLYVIVGDLVRRMTCS